jgi:mono/diheme cytochrome c family protein
MKKLLVLLFFASILVACGGGEADSASDSKQSKKALADATPEIDAKKIWKVRCMACHGLYGNQGLNGAANLQEVNISLEERIGVIVNGKQGEKGVMTAFGEILTPEEIEAVAKHTMSFNKSL